MKAGRATSSPWSCHGTLGVEWLDGTAFDGIRYIDRFEMVGGLIRRQDVWNDLSETRPRA